jgi:hypothetical protein
VHDDGDFFSQEYLDAWYYLAKKFGDKILYAYTKSLHLDLWHDKPSNLRLCQSFGGKYDNLIREDRSFSRVFPDRASLELAGYTYGNVDDSLAIDEARYIGFVYHGVCKLRDNVAERLVQ